MTLKEIGDSLGAILSGQATAKAELESLKSDFSKSQAAVTDLTSRLTAAESALEAKAEDEQETEKEKSAVDKAIEALWAEYQGAAKVEEGEEVPAEDAPEEPKEDEPAASALARIGKGFAKLIVRHKATATKAKEEAKTAGVKQIAQIGIPAPLSVAKEGEQKKTTLTGRDRTAAAINEKFSKK